MSVFIRAQNALLTDTVACNTARRNLVNTTTVVGSISIVIKRPITRCVGLD